MATLTLASAIVGHTGRDLWLECHSNGLVSHARPDSKAAAIAGNFLTFNGTVLGRPESIESFDFNDCTVRATYTAADGTIPAGSYCYRAAFENIGTGVETWVSELGADWDTSTSTSGTNDFKFGWPLTLPVGSTYSISFKASRSIPSGYVLNIYLSTLDAGDNAPGMAASLRLLKGGLTTGDLDANGVYTHDTTTFDDDERAPTAMRMWLLKYWLPANKRVGYGGTGNVVSAPAGIATDRYNNTTGAFTNFPVTNYSYVNTDGWLSTLIPSFVSGTQKYVSATWGSNTTGNGTIENPYATVARALSDVATKSSTVVYLLRGDTWPSSTARLIPTPKAGLDFDHPLIISTYWYDYTNTSQPDPESTRPLLPFVNTDLMNYPDTGGSALKDFGFIIFDGFHPRLDQTVNGDNTTWTNKGKISWLGSAQHIFFHDLDLENCSITAGAGELYQSSWVTLYRVKSRGVVNTGTGRRQGVSADCTNHFVIAECNAYKPGWYWQNGVLTANNENHFAYIHNASPGTFIVGCTVYQASSDAYKVRGGGTIAWCAAFRCGVAGNNGRHGSHYTHCVSLHGERQALGFILSDNSTCIHNESFNTIEFCIAAKVDVVSASNRAFDVLQSITDRGSPSVNLRRTETLMEHCTAFDHNNALRTVTAPPHDRVTVSNCILIGDGSGNFGVDYQLPASTSSNFASWLLEDQNVVGSSGATSGRIRVGASLVTIASTPSDFAGLGVDSTTVWVSSPPSISNPDYDIGDMFVALGGDTNSEAAWVAAVNSRGRREWFDYCDGQMIWPCFAAAYAQSVSVIDTSTFGYYGHIDYRPVGSLEYAIVGSSVGAVGVPMSLSLAPTTLTSDTVDLLSDSTGTFSITTIHFAGTGSPVAFTYTPTITGPHNLRARRTSGTPADVATKSVTVPVLTTGTRPQRFGPWSKYLARVG